MIFLASSDPDAVARVIAGLLGPSWSVVKGSDERGVQIAWVAPASVAIHETDVDFAGEISKKLSTRVVFAMSYPGSFAADLVVFDKGTRVRGISTSEDGTTTDGTPFPFESDVFDDDEHFDVDESTVTEYCQHLGLTIEPFVPVTHSVVEKRTGKPKGPAKPKPAPKRTAKPAPKRAGKSAPKRAAKSAPKRAAKSAPKRAKPAPKRAAKSAPKRRSELAGPTKQVRPLKR